MAFAGKIVERAKAGDKCVFTGVLIVIPDVAQAPQPFPKGLVSLVVWWVARGFQLMAFSHANSWLLRARD